jgi:hypothetical protein
VTGLAERRAPAPERSGILPYCPDWNREAIKINFLIAKNILLGLTRRDPHRRNGVELCVSPLLVDIVDVTFQGEAIDRTGGPKHPGHHRDLKALDILEKKRRATRLRNRLKDHPGDSRNFPILVDGLGNPVEIA